MPDPRFAELDRAIASAPRRAPYKRGPAKLSRGEWKRRQLDRVAARMRAQYGPERRLKTSASR